MDRVICAFLWPVFTDVFRNIWILFSFLQFPCVLRVFCLTVTISSPHLQSRPLSSPALPLPSHPPPPTRWGVCSAGFGIRSRSDSLRFRAPSFTAMHASIVPLHGSRKKGLSRLRPRSLGEHGGALTPLGRQSKRFGFLCRNHKGLLTFPGFPRTRRLLLAVARAAQSRQVRTSTGRASGAALPAATAPCSAGARSRSARAPRRLPEPSGPLPR